VAAASDAETAKVWDDWPATLAAGGVLCRWQLDGWAMAELMVFPVDVVPADILAASREPGCVQYDEFDAACSAALETATAWISLSRGSDNGHPLTAAPEGFSGALQLVADRLDAWGTPGAVEAVAESWTPVDCGALAETIDVADRLGDDYEAGYPGDGVEHTAAIIMAGAGAFQQCQWYGFPDGMTATATVVFLPGAAPFWERSAAELVGAVPAQVAGAERALVWTVVPEERQAPEEVALASDGTNILKVTLGGQATGVADFAERVLAAR
jgi:hypothetical protein